MDFTLGSKHFHLSIAFVLGVVLALWLFFRLGGPDLQLDQWLANGKAEVLTNRKLLAQDALHRAQAALRRRQLGDSLTKLETLIQRQQVAGEALLATAHTADQFRTAAQTFAAAGTVCQSALTLCKTRGDSLARADSAHTDSLRYALGVADTTLQRGLQVADTKHFHLAFLRLPKPPKWLTAAGGCLLGAYLDQGDHASGCGFGAAGLTVVAPTR